MQECKSGKEMTVEKSEKINSLIAEGEKLKLFCRSYDNPEFSKWRMSVELLLTKENSVFKKQFDAINFGKDAEYIAAVYETDEGNQFITNGIAQVVHLLIELQQEEHTK